ncbi:MAG: polysaccharide deacetylase family protein [Candidatus Ratteibacteria bacterium]|nr:polysaccharide deacetylase family protein [Candidatus Ratteibacteria bacterium]
MKKHKMKKLFIFIFILAWFFNLSPLVFAEQEMVPEKIKKSFYNFKERRQFRNLKKHKGIQTSVFWSGPEKSRKVALTFDDGPNPKTTLLLLETLEGKEVVATFFLIGQNAEVYPELVKEIKKRGHEIGNHSYSHPNMGRSEPLKVIQEVKKTQRILEEITGDVPTLFRPPYGTMMLEDLVIIPRFGLKMILWTVDSKDWSGINEKQIEEIILGTAYSGSIIVCHEQCRSTIGSLPRVIDALRERGYEFVTVSEIIEEE